MKSKSKSFMILGLTSLTMLTAFNNCSKQGLESIDAEAKQNLLSSSSVLSESASADCDPTTDDTCTMDDNNPPVTTSTLPAPQPQTQKQPQNVPVQRICSTNDGPKGARVKLANSLAFSILSYGTTVCTDTDTAAIKNDLKTGIINIDRCLNKAGKTLHPSSKVSFSLNMNDSKRRTYLTVKNSIQNTLSSDEFSEAVILGNVLTSNSESQRHADNLQDPNRHRHAFNSTGYKSAFSVWYDENTQNPFVSKYEESDIECDSTQSPLFVDMRDKYEKTQKFSLLAPWNGVKFNIMGSNAETANEKMQISWFKRNSGFAFIALPNEKNEVLGIDQLFGNNTKGPDGKFADNGYAALAKYDDNKDGLITSADSVFAKLRIWVDSDADGRSTARELLTMEEVELVAIDLNYDASFAERDMYRNDILYKSVAKTKNGDLKLVFDVWFETNMKKSIKYYQNSLRKLGQK